MRLFILSILFLSLYNNGYCQTVERILASCETQLDSNTEFHNKMTYTLFKSHTDNEVIEKMSGVSAKKKDTYYSKIGPTEFIFSPLLTLKISNPEKAVVISNPTFNENLFNVRITSKLLEHFNAQQVIDHEGFWECILDPITNDSPYSKYIIHISKKDYRLLRQILYLSDPILYKDNNGNPFNEPQRLEIAFSKRSKTELPKDTFDVNTYVQLIDNQYIPSPRISGYKIINAQTKTISIN
ncbi:hypothetical protein [Seonamhaeicola aphaedonensis]|uniref:Outer membrane lipoprotein-sorting protein n=1 Tax=Seonamhaeicola aphaedonensis TaxID=1461338 RepID=A0A3D9H820_9FLAO|nr:hypothetical protein [Seonamhaeicola aphaedonensis]RED45638.1 hypothetical protein DFQ02_10816 [Seonamhaeicola aphaedonensis]